MSVDRGIIVAPVTIDDVKQVLGESTNDLAALCRSSNTRYEFKFYGDGVSADGVIFNEKY